MVEEIPMILPFSAAGRSTTVKADCDPNSHGESLYFPEACDNLKSASALYTI
jgi:hypothetical protein